MRTISELLRQLTYLTRKSRFQSELEDEIRFHMETRASELEASGMSSREATLQAKREFGRNSQAMEGSRSAWQLRWIEDLVSDIRYAMRALRRNPAFAFTAVCCLALGIGANTTVFSFATSFLLSEPSAADPASLVAVRIGGNSHSSISDFESLQQANIFESIAGLNIEREANWRHGEGNQRVFVGRATSNLFTAFNIPVQTGRGLAPGETNTAVISAHFEQQLGGGDVLGRNIVLDGRSYTVVGILPSDHRTLFGFGLSPDLYLPVVGNTEIVQLYARLKSGVSLASSRDQIRALCRELDHIRPVEGWKRGDSVTVFGANGFDSLNQELPGVVVAFFGMVMIVVGLVLLIACANVASLLLARASSRSQELAVRLSLGAGRLRIVRHLLAESLLLAVLGAAAGLALNWICAEVIQRVRFPLPIPLQIIVQPDWRLIAYASSVTLISAAVSGLLPAFRAVRSDVTTVLKKQERQTGGTWNLRSILVAGQLAVSIVLLATGFLFVQNLLRAATMSPGFDIHRTVWAYMRLVPDDYKSPDKARALIDEGLAKLRALPGVESAAVTRVVPLNDNITMGRDLKIDNAGTPVHVSYSYNRVTPDYFATMGIPLLGGRDFSVQDKIGAQPVVIINEAFARRHFGSANPVGRVLRFGEEKPVTIVGVVKNSKYMSFGERDRLALYEPFFQAAPRSNLHFLVRTQRDPSAIVSAITRELQPLDSTAAIETKPMSRALAFALLPSQAGAAVLGAAGLLALFLAAIGLYGVLLYSVSRRTREIGLRMALGATPGEVLRLVLRHSLALVSIGSGVGLGLALMATRPLVMFLVPEVSPADPAAFLSVVGVLALVAVAATLGPAVRALRVDPMTALRYE